MSSLRPLQWCEERVACWLGCLAVGAAPGALLLVSLVVQSFFLLGRRKCEYLEMFMMVSGDLIWACFCSQFALVKPEELILKNAKGHR